MKVYWNLLMPSMLVSIGLIACNSTEPYYAKDGSVRVSSLDITSEQGNTGGQTIVISGSGFGNDPNVLSVQFGNQNADIIAAEDGKITVKAPFGPIYGGAVDVKVGTPNGQSSLSNGYAYNIPRNGIGDSSTRQQLAYVSITNDALSCYGGVDLDNPSAPFCREFAYTGNAGVEGRSAGFDLVYPKGHMPYVGGKNGFSPLTNISWGKWFLTTRPVSVNPFDERGNVDAFRQDLGKIQLTNRDIYDDNPNTVDEGDDIADTNSYWCADLPSMASFHYNGEDEYKPINTTDPLGNPIPDVLDGEKLNYPNTAVNPVSIRHSDFSADLYDIALAHDYSLDGETCREGGRQYNQGLMDFCMVTEYEEGDTFIYETEWPVFRNFFRAQLGACDTGLEDPAPCDKNADCAVFHNEDGTIEPSFVTSGGDCSDGEDNDEDGLADSEDPDCAPVNCIANPYGEYSNEISIPVDLKVSNLDIDIPLNLPPYLQFVNSLDTQSGDLWSLMAFDSTCPEDSEDGDRTTTGEDPVMRWTWEPVSWGCSGDSLCPSPGNEEVTAQSYIQVGISYFTLGWFGGEGTPLQATITIPDDNDYDPETGLSSLELPTWVMWSMPSIGLNYGYSQGGLNSEQIWTGYADPSNNNLGYVIFTVNRVTEYTMPTTVTTQVVGEDQKVEGDFVFAYVTGDMGFFEFTNPLDTDDTCGDCIDNDGDGWADAADPDCAEEGGAEVNPTSSSTCNDGQDNDGDGDIDSADDNCNTGNDGESQTCSNGIDDDEDGWIDQDDPECIEPNADGEIEEVNGFGTSTCNDGIDNDEDGWIDREDPECTAASIDEVNGFGTTACNDGIDNDGHGDIDSQDLFCIENGALEDSEQPAFAGNCVDEQDNDGDGYIDANDPDCELTRNNEFASFMDPAENIWVTECYDGIDNDGDCVVDGFDPNCVDIFGVPDAFVSSESLDGTAGDCNCSDGLDNDGDGWIDSDDPECDGATVGGETGYGVDACNDGIDNDADGAIDALDVFCERNGATGSTEAPNSYANTCADNTDNDADGWIDALDPDCEYTNGTQENDAIPEDYSIVLPCNDEAEDIDNPNCTSGMDTTD